MRQTIFLFLLPIVLLSTQCTEELEADNQRLQQAVDTLEVEVQDLRTQNSQLKISLGERPEVGFEVQIGAFQYFDVQAYEQEMMRLREINEGGVTKYVLGTFIRFEDAQNFLRDVKAMGINDAFIAGVVDGQRASVEEAKAAAEMAYGY